MERPDAAEIAARVRAALAYRDIQPRDYAEKVPGITPATLKRIVASKNPRGLIDAGELPAIQEATGVPMRFLAGGWAAIEEQPTLAEEVEALRHQVETLRADLAALRADAVTEEGLRAALAQTRGALGRALNPDQQQAPPL